MSKRTALDLQAALSKLDTWQDHDAEPLHRRFRRFTVRGEARLWPGETGMNPPPPATVQIRNISRGGIGLLSSEPVAQGYFWQLQLVDSGVTVATLPAFCRFCRQVVEGVYLIGAEFGVQASVMLALGVPAKELAKGDEIENQRPLTGDYVGPEALMEPDSR